MIWRTAAPRIKLKLEAGLEVVVTGRLTTYPGQSKYQIVIETLEPAGLGALMALVEERKKKLAAEGLFDEARKQLLPFLPEVIGVITSPTGAVIRDILHRLADRFPRHVLVWPVKVQGEGSAEQVAAAIDGFNALPERGRFRRPDLLIVARGGGSLEDLWSFNEEIVVRAAAASMIPLISAVGHETDVTLIDFAADRRAPTPTAAAEMAVPVRSGLVAEIGSLARRGLIAAGSAARRRAAPNCARPPARCRMPKTWSRCRGSGLTMPPTGCGAGLSANAQSSSHSVLARSPAGSSPRAAETNVERRRERYGAMALRLEAGFARQSRRRIATRHRARRASGVGALAVRSERAMRRHARPPRRARSSAPANC